MQIAEPYIEGAILSCPNFLLYSLTAGAESDPDTDDVFFDLLGRGRIRRFAVIIAGQASSGTDTLDVGWRGASDEEGEADGTIHYMWTGLSFPSTGAALIYYNTNDGTVDSSGGTAVSAPGFFANRYGAIHLKHASGAAGITIDEVALLVELE